MSVVGLILASVCADDILFPAAVMNYLAPTYAVSVFPRTTFVNRATLVCQDLTGIGHSTLWMQKYRDRGFRIVSDSEPIPWTLELKAWQRRVGDQFTWVMPYAHGKLCKSFPHISEIDETNSIATQYGSRNPRPSACPSLRV